MRIQLADFQYALNVLGIGVRILTTGFCARIVQHTVVVGHKKRTRHFFENIVAILINAKILADKCRLFHFQVGSHSGNVVLYETRTKSATAIGTLQTINLLRLLVVQTMKQGIQLLAVHTLQAFHQFCILAFHAYPFILPLPPYVTPTRLPTLCSKCKRHLVNRKHYEQQPHRLQLEPNTMSLAYLMLNTNSR